MKKLLPALFFFAFYCLYIPPVSAQSATAFAITGETQGNVNWSVIREINLTTGALVKDIYLPTGNIAHIDASTGKELKTIGSTLFTEQGTLPCACQSPSLAAASAYDAAQKRLYFSTLFGDDLQYIDFTKKDLKVYHVTTKKLRSFPVENGEGDNITRMAFGADGNGYAITNNGNHFLRFSTGKKISVADLGSLQDKAGNAVSVHTKAESWGGDLVADDAGFLYLFTVSAHVFKIDPATKEAEFLGTVTNLPTAFSINAAAVDKEGNVTVASSTDAGNYFAINIKTLAATPVKATENIYNASDFANGNLLQTEKKTDKVAPAVVAKSSTFIRIYPNPVKNKMVTVYFSNNLNGKYMIDVLDVNGNRIGSKTVNIISKTATQTLQLPPSTASGMYAVRVISTGNGNIFTSQIIVE